MKNIKLITFSFVSLIILFVVFFFHLRSKEEMVISIENSDVPIQSDVSIDLVEAHRTVNLATFDKNELKNSRAERKSKSFDIEGDGKVILQVEIDDSHYEAILIPYVTNGKTNFVIHLQIKNKDNAFFLSGEYETTLEKSKEIYTKFEKADDNDKET